MPYIAQARRDEITSGRELPETAGELNYAVTLLILAYVERQKLNYQTINDVVGALEGAKAEFQRRIVAPYEDTKISANGDVYELLCHDNRLRRQP